MAGEMDPETYYRDHWVEIEPERLEAYEEMFEWRPQLEPLLAPAELAAGQTVVDYGCGPGGLAVELARRVGESGRVHGVDLNRELLDRARRRAERDGVAGRIELHHVTDDRIPLKADSVDRVVCKNVLEYVPDLEAALAEFRRVLRPGGLAHAIDSDWGLLALEPIGPERTAELFAAASVAYRTPLIGRKLYGAFRAAGFRDVRVQAITPCDTRGLLSPVIFNMAEYARASGRMDAARIDRLIEDVRSAIEQGTYLLVLPQFLVTASA
jgi:ubiquinone/menaquinone biosynthesis C-methylase UbiE